MPFFKKGYLLYVVPVIVYGFVTLISTEFLGGRLLILPYKLAKYINPLLTTTSRLLQQKTNYVADAYTVATRNAIKELRPRLSLLANSTVARPFIKFKSHYRIAPHYSLSACTIEKAMSTILQNIFCYLYDPVGFVTNNRTISSDFWGTNYCKDKNEIWSLQEKGIVAPFMPTTIFIVRSPVQRFLSGFVDKCINEKRQCYGCYSDVLCTVEKFYAEVLRIDRGYWEDTINKFSSIGASNILIWTNSETQHFVPSNWECDLPEEADNLVFIKYGETTEELNRTYTDLMRVFESHGVEKNMIDYILSSINKRTKHETKSSGIQDKYLQQLKASPYHLQLLNKIYFYDNHIFGYEPL